MAHLYNLLAAVLFLLVARCLAHSSHKRDLVRSAEHTRDQYHPPLGSTNSHGNKQDELEMLNIVLLASVDGKLHALNRATGEILWSMASSGSSAVPSTLSPLVRTQHVMNHFSDTDDEYSSEFYVIEPQSGDIYVMSSSNGPLQRLPFTMAQLVEMSPFSFPGEEGSKVFVGKKETSMLLVELETGKVKAAINSECPWDPFEDPFEDVKDVEDELDLDELDGTKPPKAEKPTEVFIGRTDYHISIHTRGLSSSSVRYPVQNLSFSTYGPNNQDNAMQSLYRRTLDDIYIQPSSNGRIMSFRIRDRNQPEAPHDSGLMWGMSFANPIVAVMDVVKGSTRQHPFVLLQPSPRLQDVFPTTDLSTAAKLNHFPNLDSAYVGIVEETGSLFAMSPDRFPLVIFGDANGRKTIDPPPGLASSSEIPYDLDSITRARKLRQLCDSGAQDPRCMTGIRKLEADSRSRLSRLLDGVPTVPVSPPIDMFPPPSSRVEDLDNGSSVMLNVSIIPPWPKWIAGEPSVTNSLGQSLQFMSALAVALLTGVGFVVVKTRRHKTLVNPIQVANVNSTPTIIPVGDFTTQIAIGTVLEKPDVLSGVASTPETEVLPALSDLPDGDDSDRDEENISTGKRKPMRRRRGKKKKAGVTDSPELENGHAGSELLAAVLPRTPESHSGISLPTPKAVIAPTTLTVSDTILGFGSHGTVVFKGSLQGRAVAVKRLLRDFVTLASREVSILEESDDHSNVIRYYYQEAQANFLYIAIELCPASLADIIERPDNFRDIAITFDPKRALRQVTSGLRHLHALKIVHRDIKPQNIMVSSAKKGAGNSGGHRMLISDFGLCKKLDVDQNSFMPTAFGAMAAGTVGWRAPEILRGEVKLDDTDMSQSSRGSVATANGSDRTPPGVKPTKLTKTVDIFALGCLFYYCLTGGGHPFGDRFEREINILKDAKSLDGLSHFGEEGSEAADLISKMLDPQASLRPDTTSCLLHPYFWDADRRLGFLQDASDRFEVMCREPRERDLITLETEATNVVGQDWRLRLDKSFLENLGKFRKYDGRSVQDLLRALRNKKHHYQDLPESVKRQLHPMPEGYLSYFTRRFPELFMHVHSVVDDSALRHESMFRSYFELSEQ